jgi:superfamily I DNA/RNA helicase
MKFSSYQEEIFKAFENHEGHFAIIARAGSGKSTTLVEGSKRRKKNRKTLFVAFNKTIQTEMSKKLTDGVECLTLHSFGLRIVKKRFPGVVIDDNKSFNIIRKIVGGKNFNVFIEMKKAVSLCKATISDSPTKVSEIMYNYDIDPGEMDRNKFISHVINVMAECKRTTSCIDFDDMVWFPFVHNIPAPKYDDIIVDEAQDLNFSQLLLIKSAAKETSRIIMALDPCQAIYGFRAADYDTVHQMLESLNPLKLSLPISYRCPRSVIRAAQTYVSDIEWHENAPEGLVEELPESALIKNLKAGDVVISRNNADLIKACMQAIKNNIPSHILGKNIGTGLLSIIKKSNASTIPNLLAFARKWRQEEISKAMESNRPTDSINDNYSCIVSLAEFCSSVSEIKDKIKTLFDDDDDCKTKVTFSTTHKFKGNERDRVHLLRWTYMLGDCQEEKNILYVAITRAKKELRMFNRAASKPENTEIKMFADPANIIPSSKDEKEKSLAEEYQSDGFVDV